MNYYINHTAEGKILGYLTQEATQELSTQVTKQEWEEAHAFNTIDTQFDTVEFSNQDHRDLKQLKADRIAWMLQQYHEEIVRPVPYNECYFDGGEHSVLALNEYIQTLHETGAQTYEIWDVDNTIKTYTYEEAVAIKQAIALRVSVLKLKLRQKKNEVQAATTAEQIKAVLW